MTAWSAIASATAVEHRLLLQSLDDCGDAQVRQLDRLLAANAGSHFGRQHGFHDIGDPDAYRSRVPLRDYAELTDVVGPSMADGLVGEPVVLYEETSGSTGGAKLIPYTARSLAGFRAALHPWLHDLAHAYPSLGTGYFAISPVARPPRSTASGVPIGADNDRVYFGEALAEPLAAITAVPPQVARLTDVDAWQYATLLHLLRTDDLTFASVWSPTFLTGLLAALPRHAERLLRHLHDGVPAEPGGEPPIAADPARARTLADALAGGSPFTPRLWPGLRLISSWADAGAARFLGELQHLFPHADIQGKGLLSTEAAVSLPLTGHPYPVLAVNSGFFEFLDRRGDAYLAHETTVGEVYELVISVPGLYRYRNGDQVRVQGRAGSTPLLEFVGRAGLVSDLVGEKLTDTFVCDCLDDLQGFAMLAPRLDPCPHYQLFVEHGAKVSLAAIENRLRRNPHYAYARAIGQLDRLRLVPVDGPLRRYQAAALNRGQRLGDIKPPSLRPEPDWETWMCS